MTRMIYVNLPVRDLSRSVDFFKNLGFEFNPEFTDEKATCMVISDTACVMLLVEPFFQGFTKKDIADRATSTEVILALSVDSREEVDALVDQALAAGGEPSMDATDEGFMYLRSFQDVDGHLWEVIWMDPDSIDR